MFIEEIGVGEKIELEATIGTEQIKFETVVTETYNKKHMILTDPVYKNEKVITFHAKGLIVNLSISPSDSPPVVFKNVSINLMKKADDSLCYSITSIAEGKAINRRESFRCYVGVNSAVQAGGNRAAHDAVIKDVSVTGFAVTCNDPEVEFRENQVLHVVLNDYLEELAENYSFQMYGIVVRVQELDNGRKIYGCKLNNKVPGLDAYIFKKERLRLKKQNGR